MLTREPGGSPGAEVIRHVLLSGAAKPLGPKPRRSCSRPRATIMSRTPSGRRWTRGAWVICDRFADSTRVYQGVLGNVDPRLIQRAGADHGRRDRPDLTFILDVPAEVGLARASKRRGGGDADRFESEALEFHEQLRDGLSRLAGSEPDAAC